VAQAQEPITRKRGPSRALRLVRSRLDNPQCRAEKAKAEASLKAPALRPRDPKPSALPLLPYEEFCPGALADERCAHCFGGGVRTSLRGLRREICPCVYRAIARRCAKEYLYVTAAPSTKPRYRPHKASYDMPHHEWVADFWRLMCKTLSPLQVRIWFGMRIYQLSWKEISRDVGLDRGSIFRELYRADRSIGERVCSLKPYPLWTPRQYRG
jgi:hypothetical protein